MEPYNSQRNFPLIKLAMVSSLGPLPSTLFILMPLNLFIKFISKNNNNNNTVLSFVHAILIGTNFVKYWGMLVVIAALHELDPVFKRFSYSEKISSLLSSLGYKRPIPIQSMYIFKVLHLLVFKVEWFDMMSLYCSCTFGSKLQRTTRLLCRRNHKSIRYNSFENWNDRENAT